jgi:glycosyltransferase involved in cell wall biosynthesis
MIARALAGRPDGSPGFEIAYHGTITQWYGVDLIVRAVAILRSDLPGVRAVVLGEGDALEEARGLARALGVADRIEFSGRYLPIEEALARVATADCGVIPNRPSVLNRFALSSKLFEYVALGIPVVVSRLETLEAHFDASEVTFFEPGDAELLAAAIQSVARSRSDARSKARAASSRAESYSWQVNRLRYQKVLEGLSS